MVRDWYPSLRKSICLLFNSEEFIRAILEKFFQTIIKLFKIETNDDFDLTLFRHKFKTLIIENQTQEFLNTKFEKHFELKEKFFRFKEEKLSISIQSELNRQLVDLSPDSIKTFQSNIFTGNDSIVGIIKLTFDFD